MKNFILIFLLLISFASFCQSEIDYQNKRLISSLNKNGISGFSELEEISCNLKEHPELQGKFFKTLNNSENSEVKYVFVGRVNSCRAGGCSISGNTPANSESEYFDYYIFFDLSKTVKQVEVFNYQATQGYWINRQRRIGGVATTNYSWITH